MIIEKLAVGPILTNCYVVGDERTHKGAVIDPGGDADEILDAVKALRLEIVYVIDTHAHFDHILANAEVLAATGAKLVLHAAEAPLLAQGGAAAMFGIPNAENPPADIYVQDGDTLKIGDIVLQVLHTPGHTPGQISLYDAQTHVLFSGDLLFYQGIGRTDLPGGDYDAIMSSLEHVLSLPEETIVYPGHGPETTIADEKAGNPVHIGPVSRGTALGIDHREGSCEQSGASARVTG